MIKTDLGTKRVCPSCAARFYDLQKRPIECPKCAFAFEPEILLKQRRTRAPEPAKAASPAVVVDAEDDEELEDEDDEEVEEAEEEAVDEVEADIVEEVVEDEEEASPGMSVTEDADEEEEEFEDLDDDDDEDDDTLHEEVEEDEEDVSDIIDADLDKEEG